ncbi:MAG: ribosomal protein S18-alanine N-acetyltransferase [Actinobacteria bacterium]|nr:ribosomal protein S18-alanine N-acetyltransferase [Actinomycetota bacterium]
MISYRAATREDLPTLFSIEVELYPIDAWSLDIFDSEFDGIPDTRYYVVAESDEIIGYAGLFSPLTGEVADIQTMTVVKSEQGKGIGKELLRLLVEEALRREAPDVLLEVREDNASAIGLYKGAGFEEISRRKNYYAPGIHALIMAAPSHLLKEWLTR